MNRFRIALIALITIILVTASLGQNLGEIFTKAHEEIAAENYDAARQQLQLILQQSPTYAPAYFELSKLSLIQDDLRGAQENINAAIQNDPRNEEYRAEAEKIADISSLMSQARRSYDERDYMGSVALYEKVIEDHPTFANAYYGMGMAFAREGDLRQAAQAFTQAQTYNPNDPRYSNALLKIVADQYNEGNRLYKARDWEAAVEAYQEAYQLDPGFEQAYYRVARSYLNLGESDSALKMLDKAIEIEPDYIIAYVDKGNILRGEGLVDEAEAVYRKALSIDPEAERAWLGLGAVLRNQNLEEAINAFESALAVNPTSGDAAEYLGEIYSEQEEWEEAKKYLEQAVKIKRNDHIVLWRYAHVLNALEEYEQARLMARRSTSINQNFEYGWYELGLAEKALGNRVAAIAAFRNALKGRDASIRKNAQYELDQLELSNNR
ncbi:tetratricopeptide repeat protein [Candidatus Neomarinimicrobiota bacterium]